MQKWRGVSVLVRLLLSTFNFICSHLILTRVFFLVTRLQGNNMPPALRCTPRAASPIAPKASPVAPAVGAWPVHMSGREYFV